MFANLQTAYGELARAQFELQSRTNEVTEASGLLQRVVESMSEALFLLDPHGRVVRTNPGAGRLLGSDPLDLVGKVLADVCGTDALPATPWQVLEKATSGVLPDIEVEIRTRHRGAVPVSASCGLVRDRRGEIIGTLSVVRDITDRRRAAEAQRFVADASRLSAPRLRQPMPARRQELPPQESGARH